MKIKISKFILIIDVTKLKHIEQNIGYACFLCKKILKSFNTLKNHKRNCAKKYQFYIDKNKNVTYKKVK